MDENKITDQQETAEVEFSAEETAAFDEGWGDEDVFVPTPESEDEEPDDSEEPDAQPEAEEQPDEADGAGGDEASDEEEQAGTEQEKQDDAGSQRFTLRFLGEDRDVTLEEMRELAEKGMNYDHVREERDNLKGEKQKLADYEGFLKDLAESAGTDIDGLIEDTRVRLLVQKAEGEGKELSEEDARAQVRKAAKTKDTPASEPAEKTQEEIEQEIVMRFVKLYPNLKGEEIPQSVWDEANRVGDIVGPYQKYIAEQQAKKIAELEKNLRNQKNRERSTGSRRTAGATTPKDAFDEGWDSSF